MKALLLGALLLFATSATSATFNAKVIAVLDGDTVLIKRQAGVLKVRLVEIDAPEKSQPFGASSQQSLAGMVLGKQVQFTSQAFDQYERMIAHLNVNGLDVNAEQIKRGMAWEYSHFHSNHALVALEVEARAAPRGLWAMSAPIAPWDWRKQHPSTTSPPSIPNASVVHDASCGGKKQCSQMSSCDEARHYLSVCGLKYLDGDGDGMPCEKLCALQPREAAKQ
ncbi:MAG: hypothetical protein RL358_1208 [Pseudomonadota bacterium]|jgi:endonuclease YncB( thermonuclease family)